MNKLERAFVEQYKLAWDLLTVRVLRGRIGDLSDEQLYEELSACPSWPREPVVEDDNWLFGPLRAMQSAVAGLHTLRNLAYIKAEDNVPQ